MQQTVLQFAALDNHRITLLACSTPYQFPRLHTRRRTCQCYAAVDYKTETVDVAVIGSGIIGLCITHKCLQSTSLSVALFDREQPCAGATGAGQGYIWLAHRDPATPSWALARHSKAKWEQLAAAAAGGNNNSSSRSLAKSLEWQANGSLLLATTSEEVRELEGRAAMLQKQGIPGVILLSPRELKMREPALQLPTGSQGLLVKSDAQIDGRRAAFGLLKACQQLSAEAAEKATGSCDKQRRLLIGLNESVLDLQPNQAEGSVDVITESRKVHARHGVIVAAGVWSGQLLSAVTGQAAWQQLLQPRRGHLLEIAPPPGMPPLNTGMMELSYTQHYSQSAANHGSQESRSSANTPALGQVDITFTATMSASESLLIGSSREFSGWQQVSSKDVMKAILQRATQFLPHLGSVKSDDITSTRVGLRPYAVGGLPLIGPVGGLPGVVIAAGHEGSGLCLGPATADLALYHIMGSHMFLGEWDSCDREELVAAARALMPANRLVAVTKTA